MPALEGEATALHAVIAEGGGIIAVAGPDGEPLPLVTYVPRIAAEWITQLDNIAANAGCRVFLLRADNVVEIATAAPRWEEEEVR